MRSLPGSRLIRSVYGSAGDQYGMNSPGAPPRQASTKAAVSRTVLVWQPWIETIAVRSDTPGALEKTPRDIFRPILPLMPAGMRIDPPPSVAWEIGSTPAATLAPVPEDDPPAVNARSHGLCVTYISGFSAEPQVPNSGVVVRPMMLRPA